QVAARAVGGDQLADRALAVVAGPGGGGGAAAGGLARGGGDLIDDRGMRDVAGLAALEAVEPGFPGGPDGVGGDEVLLVQVLDEAGIGAQLRGLRKLLQETVHSGIGKLVGGGGPCNM